MDIGQIDLTQLSREELLRLQSALAERLNTLPQAPYGVVDLFCGAGGLAKGLEMAGLTPLVGVDCDKDALATYQKNFPGAKTFLGPISELTRDHLLELIANRPVTLLAAGPPSQGVSPMGEQNDSIGAPTSFIDEFLRILEFLAPPFVLFENVPGITAKRYGPLLTRLMATLERQGYKVSLGLYEAQQYGVPQKRKRAIIWGHRNFPERFLPHPLKICDIIVDGHYIYPPTVGSALATLADASGVIHNHELDKVTPKDELTRERLNYIPQGRGIRYQKDEEDLLPAHLKLGVAWQELRERRLREVQLFRLNEKRPAPTIQTQNHHCYHPTQARRLTIRELAALQSFPNDFIFQGSFNSQQRQVGSALPPLLAKAVGEAMMAIINNDLRNRPQRNTTYFGELDNHEAQIDYVRKNAFKYQLNDENALFH